MTPFFFLFKFTKKLNEDDCTCTRFEYLQDSSLLTFSSMFTYLSINHVFSWLATV